MTHSLSLAPPPSGRLRLSRTVSISPAGTVLLDAQRRVVSVNPAAQALLGRTEGALVNRAVFDWIHPDDHLTVKLHLHNSQMDHPVSDVRLRVRQGNGAWLDVTASILSFLQDPDVQATVLQLQPEQRLQDTHRAALWEIAQRLNTTDQLAEAARVVVRQCLQVIGAGAGSVSVLSADGQQLELAGQVGFSTRLALQWRRFPITFHIPITDVARHQQALFLTHDAFQTRYPKVHQQHVRAFRSAALLPLMVNNQLLGVLALSFQHDQNFGSQEQRFLQMVASLCAPALERSRLHHQLHRQEQWKHAVNVNSSDIATVLDAEGLIRYESGAIERLLGYSATELIGLSMYPLIHPDDHPSVQHTLAQLSPGSAPVTATFRCRHRDGHWVWLESIAVDLHHQPHVNGLLVNSRDVSAREEARLEQQDILERLTISERNFKRLADHASDLVRQYALDGSVVYASPTARDLLGYDSEDLLGPDPLYHVHDDDLPALQAAFQRRFDPTFEQEKFEYRLRRRDGTYVWVETVFKAIRDPHTQAITAFIDTSRDIDQRKQAEQHLNVQLARYHQLLDFTASLEQLRDPAALTAEALHKCLELTEYDYGYAFAWSATGLTFEAQAGLTSSAISDLMDDLRLHALTPAVDQRIRRGEAYFGTDDEVFLDPPEALPRLHWRSLCVLPILRQGTLMAVLVFGTSTRMTCSQDTRQLLQNVAARLSHALERHHHLEQLNTSREETLRALGLALEYRDYETKGHTDRVVRLTEMLGKALRFPHADQDALRWGAFLHDTGKVAIPDNILLKPGKLTPEEWDVIKRHPTIGYEMLHPIPSLPPATLEVVLSHQERWNGSGYPDGLQGCQIPLSARVFAVVDVYDALTSHRPYKRAWSHQEAAEQLQLEAGVLLDEAVVQTFLDLFQPDGSFRSLPDDEVPHDPS